MPDFPTTPVDGDTHVIATSTWKYYSSTDRWEIEDTSGVPQSVSTLLETLTWTAGDATVTSSPIVYSDYSTIIITYAGIHAFSSGAITAFQVKNSPTGTANEIRVYGVGDHQLTMAGTSTILTATGTSNSNTTINSVTTDVQNLSFTGPDYSTLIFGWAGTGIFAAGGSIEIRGISLQIAANTLAHLDDVNATVPTDGQVLTWDNTNGYWKPDDITLPHTTLAGYGITDAATAADLTALATSAATAADLAALAARVTDLETFQSTHAPNDETHP